MSILSGLRSWHTSRPWSHQTARCRQRLFKEHGTQRNPNSNKVLHFDFYSNPWRTLILVQGNMTQIMLIRGRFLNCSPLSKRIPLWRCANRIFGWLSYAQLQNVWLEDWIDFRTMCNGCPFPGVMVLSKNDWNFGKRTHKKQKSSIHGLRRTAIDIKAHSNSYERKLAQLWKHTCTAMDAHSHSFECTLAQLWAHNRTHLLCFDSTFSKKAPLYHLCSRLPSESSSFSGCIFLSFPSADLFLNCSFAPYTFLC